MPVKRPALAALPSLVLLASSPAERPAVAPAPENYLLIDDSDIGAKRAILERPDIAGAQRIYSWRSLEPREGVYDFSAIEHDLSATNELHKQLFIQIQDRFFEPKARRVPGYLLNDPKYHGGLAQQGNYTVDRKPSGYGWVAQQWNPAVRARYQALLQAIAARFDGRVRGVNLPETSIDIDSDTKRAGFTCDAYFDGELENLAFARRVFAHSTVVQYVNFWPCEWNNSRHYMSRMFEFAAEHGVGLGGPDVVPFRRGQMANSYPFFHRYKGRLKLVAMAVQEPTLTYTNPKTGKRFTRAEFAGFATNYLGADVIFWTASAPWFEAKR